MSWLHTHRKTLILICMALLVLLVVFWLGGVSVDDIIGFTSGVAAPLSAAIIVGLFCLKPMAIFTPSTALYLAAGILFSPLAAILVVYVGSALEAMIGYYLGHSLGYERVSQLMARNKRAMSFLAYQQNSGATTCFLSRVMPIPFDLASMFYGAIGTRFGVFIVFSLLGSTPWIVSWAFAGDAITNPLSAEFLVPFGICLGITGVVFLLSRWLQRRGNSGAPESER